MNSAQREAIGNALASMNLELRPTSVATVSPLVGAAVRARCDALLALGDASAEQQLAVLNAVAAVFEKEGVSLAELGRSLPLAEQLAIHAEWVQRIERGVRERRERTLVLDLETNQQVLPGNTQAAFRKRKKTLADQSDEQKAPRRRPNHPCASNPSHVRASRRRPSRSGGASPESRSPSKR